MKGHHLSPGRVLAIWTLLAAASLATLVATLSIWAERQLLDTGEWTRASADLLADREVRRVVSREVVAFLDLRGAEIEAQTGLDLGLEDVTLEAVDGFLGTEQAVVLFREANGQVHGQLVSALKGDEADGPATVAIDLGPLATSFARQYGLPEEAGTIDAEALLVRSDELASARRPVRAATRVPAAWLALIAAGLYALAIALAGRNRPHVIAAAGASLALVGLLLIAARAVVGDAVLDSFVADASFRPAIRSAWLRGTQMIRQAGLVLIAGGGAAIVAGALAGLLRRR